jgi:ribonuclease VapC
VILDTSALVAILLEEPGFEELERVLWNSQRNRIAAPTMVELSVVMDSRLPPAQRGFTRALVDAAKAEVVPFTSTHATIAREAYQRFGKGSGSRAKLNMGDTFSYALAAATGEPLFFVGEDFTHTDIRSALA